MHGRVELYVGTHTTTHAMLHPQCADDVCSCTGSWNTLPLSPSNCKKKSNLHVVCDTDTLDIMRRYIFLKNNFYISNNSGLQKVWPGEIGTSTGSTKSSDEAGCIALIEQKWHIYAYLLIRKDRVLPIPNPRGSLTRYKYKKNHDIYFPCSCKLVSLYQATSRRCEVV